MHTKSLLIEAVIVSGLPKKYFCINIITELQEMQHCRESLDVLASDSGSEDQKLS